MGLFDTIKDFGSSALGLNDKKNAQRYSDDSGFNLGRAREEGLAAANRITGPELTEQNKRRIAALERESDTTIPFSQDALLQGERAALLGGGARALSSIGRSQAAYGVRGGFSNVGSPQDVQDRMSIALSQLAGKSRAIKEEKRDRAAEITQDIANLQAEYNKARQMAIIAVEQGNASLASQSLQYASQLRQKAIDYQKQLVGDVVSSVSGGMFGGSKAPAKPPGGGNQAGGSDLASIGAMA